MENTVKWGELTTRPITSFLEYLIGVPRKYMKEEECAEYGNIQRVRAVRRLCQLRTQIMRNFTEVNNSYKRGLYFGDIASTSAPFERARAEGVTLTRQESLSKELIAINNWIYGFINDAIEPLSEFDVDLEWIRDLLVMPGGNTVEGVQKAMKSFVSNRNFYPYQMYINWEFNLSTTEQKGLNLLRSDETFLAELHARYTPALENDQAKEFCNNAKRLSVIVDTENVDPSKLFGLVKECPNLTRIILIDDNNSSELWFDFEKLAEEQGVTVERIETNRLNQKKSVVDLVFVQRCCAEYYENKADSIIVASSDSDYMSVITTLSGVRFAVALERAKTSSTYLRFRPSSNFAPSAAVLSPRGEPSSKTS